MKTEENLNSLFALLKSENASTSPSEISNWLESASIVTSSAKVRLSLKVKAILMSKTGWIIFTTVLTITGISGYLIIASDTKTRTEKNGDVRHNIKDSSTKIDSVRLILKKQRKNEKKINEDCKKAIVQVDQSLLQLKPLSLQPFYLHKEIPKQNLHPFDTLNALKKWAGIYKNYDDFTKGKYCDSILFNVGKNKIYVSSFDRLIIKTESRKTIYKLGSVYGFYNGKNLLRYGETTSTLKDYGYFTVQETDGLILYSQMQTGYKGTQHTCFFYSKTLNSQIKNLSVKNLNLDFSKKEFIEEVRKKVEKLTNMGMEKWQVALEEINATYRKYYP